LKRKKKKKPAILARHVGGISHGKRSTLEEQKTKSQQDETYKPSEHLLPKQTLVRAIPTLKHFGLGPLQALA
jgi:hypothetical protein